MQELHQVVSAVPVEDRWVRVSFENGVSGTFDCAPYMKDKYWGSLNNPAFFRLVKAEYGTLCWPNDIDIDPEEVWEDLVRDADESREYPPIQETEALSVAECQPSPYQS